MNLQPINLPPFSFRCEGCGLTGFNGTRDHDADYNEFYCETCTDAETPKDGDVPDVATH